MFTGIIQEIGSITAIKANKETATATIKSEKLLKGRKIGDSIAVDGICSTITKLDSDSFEVQYMQETLKLTTASSFKENTQVNLEVPIKAGDTFDGHFVQGHVDCKGKIAQINAQDETAEITIEFPEELTKFTAIKGSTTINGVSLTISKIEMGKLTVSLIPHTLQNTNLGTLKKGDEVNIEVDLLARYIKNLLDDKEEETTYQFLRERNII